MVEWKEIGHEYRGEIGTGCGGGGVGGGGGAGDAMVGISEHKFVASVDNLVNGLPSR